MRIRKLNHSVYEVQYHIVWGTKYRRKILKEYVRTELFKCLQKLTRKYPGWYFHRINAETDHVHVLMEIPPKMSVSEAVKKMKCESSLSLKRRFKFIREMYDEGMWSVGYFVSTIGMNEGRIRRYIELQNQYDLGLDLTSEFS